MTWATPIVRQGNIFIFFISSHTHFSIDWKILTTRISQCFEFRYKKSNDNVSRVIPHHPCGPPELPELLPSSLRYLAVSVLFKEEKTLVLVI